MTNLSAPCARAGAELLPRPPPFLIVAEVVLVLRDVCPTHRWDAEKNWDAEKTWAKREPSWQPETIDHLLVDSFETPLARPSLAAMQKKFYSGKKKRHTVKTQIVTDKRGEVIAIETGH